jgi:hypothetical protein
MNFQTHAIESAKKRYGIEIQALDLKLLVERIKQNKYIWAERVSGYRTLVFIEFLDKNILLVYSKKHQQIITFLPVPSKLNEFCIGHKVHDLRSEKGDIRYRKGTVESINNTRVLVKYEDGSVSWRRPEALEITMD